MTKMIQPDVIPISSLNALEYCPRRFYYEFVQGDMIENEFVLEGTLLHRRVDTHSQRITEEGEVHIRRLYVQSETLRLTGFLDLVEEEDGHLIPIEYKRGREGKWINDHVQVCAQALCLEERLPEKAPIPYGYVFYYGSHKRVQIPLSEELRRKTKAMIELAFYTTTQKRVPAPLEGKSAARCRDCSLHALCLPEEVRFFMQKEGMCAHTLFD